MNSAVSLTVLLAASTAAAVSANRATPPRCTPPDVQVTKGSQQHAAHRSRVEIVFVNGSHHSCTLRGFPVVQAVGSHTDPLGAPAAHEHLAAAQTVVLRPGGRAHADFIHLDAATFAPLDCRPVTASWLEVHPPGSDRSGPAAYLPWRRLVCTNLRDSSVQPVRPGAG